MSPPTAKSLHDVVLTDIDFPVIKACTDKNFLKKYIKLIQDDGNYFHDLLRACKDKLLEVAPKDYYLMYPKKASEDEVHDAMEDLLDWEATVKETDAALMKSKEVSDKIWDDLPGAKVKIPIRGQEAVPSVARPNVQKKEGVPKAQLEDNRTAKDIRARDKTKMKDYYNAWDKVDVDELEAELDKEEREAEEARRRHFDDLKEEQDQMQATTPIEIGDAASSVPEAHRKHMADSEKEKGNEAFYAKDWDEAEAYYTRSIHFRADDTSTWTNRALVRLKLDQPQKALVDCEHAIALNPKYMKALHRKGKALYELGRYEDAVKWFQLALAESPGNTQINGDLMVARRRLRSDGPGSGDSERVSRSYDAAPSCRIEEVADDLPPSSASAKAAPVPAGYTRVQIEEDSDSEEEVPVVKSAAAKTSEPAKGSSAGSRGFTKVAIEEVSGSEDEGDSPQGEAGASKPSTAPSALQANFEAASTFAGARPGFAFQKGEKGLGYYRDLHASAGKLPDVKPFPAARSSGFRKVAIVEESDSEGDEPHAPAPSGRFNPPPREAAAAAPPVVETTATPPAAQGATAVSFDDMD